MDNRMENRFGNKVDGQPGYNTFYPNGIESDEMKNEIEIDVRSLFATILNRLFVIIKNSRKPVLAYVKFYQ